jgi:hypothetical protein
VRAQRIGGLEFYDSVLDFVYVAFVPAVVGVEAGRGDWVVVVVGDSAAVGDAVVVVPDSGDYGDLRGPGRTVGGLEQEMMEGEERRERDERIVNWFERAFHILNAYQSHQASAKELRMSLLSMQLALGFHLAAGADGPAELARRCGVSRQCLNKCLNHFLEQLNIERLPFQRDEEARENMSAARKEQLAR